MSIKDTLPLQICLASIFGILSGCASPAASKDSHTVFQAAAPASPISPNSEDARSNRIDPKGRTVATSADSPAGQVGKEAPNKKIPGKDLPNEDVLRQLLSQLNKKIETLEIQLTTQLAAVNDKLDATRLSVDRLSSAQKPKPRDSIETKEPKTSEVIGHPSEKSGAPTVARLASQDPENGFANDEPIQAFRKAMIILQAQNYTEAILAFSSFLEKFPDHPLAGTAQYYVGLAYLKQKEYKLAITEFQRVLTSYDRSPHVSDTLREMATAEDQLKNSRQAAIHRHLLTSLFPQSPAAEAPSNKPESNVESPEATEESPSQSSSSSTTPLPPPTAPLEEFTKEAASNR